MAVLENFDHIGKLGSTSVYFRITGQQHIDYELKLVVTDFRGEAYTASFTFDDLLSSECLAGYEPDHDELLRWIQASLTHATLRREPGGGIGGLQAPHEVSGTSQTLRLQYPPLGACDKLAGSAAHGVIADFAGALFQSYVQEKDAGAAKAAENTALQEEVKDLQSGNSRLLGKLQELRPGAVLSATGSFKRAASNPKRGAAPAKEALPDPATLGEAAAVGLAQSQHAEQPAEHDGAPPIVAPRIVRGRGRARAGLTARIGR